MIRKVKSKWVLYSKSGGGKLGSFSTKKAAVKREKQIVYFKNSNKR
jgi:hypothetical protein